MIYTALTKKAMKVAYEAHHGQTDRSGTPYIFHPFHVAEQMDDELSVCTALLHDVGRADPDDTGRKHHELSVEYAGRILEQCGFSTQENEQICDAIGSHNTDGAEREGLAYVLYNADKLSRNCFDCEASDQCYWLESARNTGIKY